jgi:hypothetical protein
MVILLSYQNGKSDFSPWLLNQDVCAYEFTLSINRERPLLRDITLNGIFAVTFARCACLCATHLTS